MKIAIRALVLLVLTPGLSFAQDKAALEKTLIANEQKINEAVAKGDKATFSSLVAAGAMSVDKSGFMPIAEFLKVFDQVKIKSWKIDNPQVQWIDANNAIVNYTWTGTGTFMNQPVDSPTLASTLWTKKGTKWTATFHSEIAAAKK
ncbi:MAG TPA: nuclear transport factor 2 family protein [Vicinamibacterales bacterium]|nr:nuclear transport factor 2 family protein [Vicinamibacterales bacterium]